MENDKKNYLTDEDRAYIRTQYYIDCPEANDKSTNSLVKCSIHGIRHKRTPDLETFAFLISKYPMVTLREWGEVFNVTREAIRVLAERISDDFDWGTRRLELRYGKAPDWAFLEKFFSMLSDRDDLAKGVIYEVVDIDPRYVSYWRENNHEVERQYQDAIQIRELKSRNPIKQTCSRCSMEYPIENFNRDKNTKSGYGRTCKPCAYATVKAYNKKRVEEFDMSNVDTEKFCPTCERVKSRDQFYICKANRGGLQGECASCQNKKANSHPKRRQKFIEVGLDKPATCRTCNKEKDYINFYLLRRDQKNIETSFVSLDCRDCFKAETNRFLSKNNVSLTPFQIHGAYRSQMDLPLREYFDVFLYDRYVAPNEEEVARTDETQEMIKRGKFKLWTR